MTGRTETPDRTILLRNQNNNFMHYARVPSALGQYSRKFGK